MEDTALIWAAIGFATAIAIRNLVVLLRNRKNSNENYARELSEILTKEEYKVKGKFE